MIRLHEYTVTAFENLDTNFLHPYRATDRLAEVGTFTVQALSVADAAEALWPVGNKMETDARGASWPVTRRSLSVGDVVDVTTADGTVRYACDAMGWTPILPGQSL